MILENSLISKSMSSQRVVRILARHEAEVIIKGTDYIIGYTSDEEVFSIKGIVDFTGYLLLDNAEWDPAPMSSEEMEKRIEVLTQKMIEFGITL